MIFKIIILLVIATELNSIQLLRFYGKTNQTINYLQKPELLIIEKRASKFNNSSVFCIAECYHNPACGSVTINSNNTCLFFTDQVTLLDTTNSTGVNIFSKIKLETCFRGMHFVEGFCQCLKM